MTCVGFCLSVNGIFRYARVYSKLKLHFDYIICEFVLILTNCELALKIFLYYFTC